MALSVILELNVRAVSDRSGGQAALIQRKTNYYNQLHEQQIS